MREHLDKASNSKLQASGKLEAPRLKGHAWGLMLLASLVLGACGLEFSCLARWFVDLHLRENPDDPEPAAEKKQDSG